MPFTLYTQALGVGETRRDGPAPGRSLHSTSADPWLHRNLRRNERGYVPLTLFWRRFGVSGAAASVVR
jgi:hypothetical protein